MDNLQNLTLEDLKVLIDERIRTYHETALRHKRPLAEVLAAVEAHRWTPPAGTPSITELVREDRDR
jgi:hypothetical protein